MFERFSNIKKVHNPTFPNRWEWGVQIRPFLGVQNPPFLGGVLGPPRGGPENLAGGALLIDVFFGGNAEPGGWGQFRVLWEYGPFFGGPEGNLL